MSMGDLRVALYQFVATGTVSGAVRDEILRSWHRSVSSYLRHDRFDVPYDARPGDERLQDAARPVLDQLSEDLAGARMGLLLTDGGGHVSSRWVADRDLATLLDHIQLAPGFVYGEEHVGTNAIGTALSQDGPSVVRGGEHFADALTDMACSAAPITDLRTGSFVGVVDLTCRAPDANELMLPVAKHAARDIEHRLLTDVGVAERKLLHQFLQTRRRARGAVVALNEHTMFTNAAAARLLRPDDQPLLWTLASMAVRAGTSPGSDPPTVALTDGTTVAVRWTEVSDGDVRVGFLLRLGPPAGEGPGEVGGRQSSQRPRFGWESLTENEHGVADLVASGLTNREVATQLIISPHTVDFHLRQIFRKLGIRSRVELTRLVVMRTEAD